MIQSSPRYPLTLTFDEIAALDGHVARVHRRDLSFYTAGASWSASAHGVTICFAKEVDCRAVAALVEEAMDELYGEDD